MAGDGQESQEIVLSVLREIIEPTGKNLLDAGIVAGLRGEGSRIAIQCRDPKWPDPIRQRIEREIQTKLQARFGPDVGVAVEWTAAASGPGANAGAAPQPGMPAVDIRHVIAVGSGKGGVGKSTIAACLAYALRYKGFRVGLMDADVYGPSIPHMLGLVGQPAVAGGKYVPPQADDIKVISMGFLVPAEQAVVWRGPMLHKAVRDFLFMVDWGPLDYLIVDLPPGTGDVVLSLSQQMPLAGGVIVCTPQDVALLDARKALHMLDTVKVPCRGIVENMSLFICPHCGQRTDIFGHGGAEAWARESGVPFLGSVPLNVQVRENGDRGRIRDNFDEDGPVKQALLDLADRLIDSVAATPAPAAPTIEVIG